MKIELTEEESQRVYEILGDEFFETLERSRHKRKVITGISMVFVPLLIGALVYFSLPLFF